MDKNEKLSAYVKKYGIACGGNWVAMLASAIQNGDPEIYNRIHWNKWGDSRRSRVYQFVTLASIIKNSCTL